MKFRLTLIASVISFVSLGQLKSPEDFLGYQLGTRFTYHYQLVDYCKHVASQRSDISKWHSYGKTNEGRELGILLLAKTDIQNSLDRVKAVHHLVIQGQKVASAELPVIINLSFNVHGNEAAGSEAALGAIYDLVKPEGILSKSDKSYVILIDPCINPDGRDAYVTQYNRRNFISGGNVDPNDQEHFEGATSGRYNHYSFDLNRDWVWQTQVETKQRIAFFQSWLPMVHADFHEQSYQHSYYFPPAAKPYFNFISSTTKDLQTSVGKSFAGLFDQQKWPYFTSEVYDLFYPGYGDTYPVLNGSLGMTLEQGGIRGGLRAQKSNLDTITFVDRVNHHRQLALNLVQWSLANSDAVKSSFYTNHLNARTNPSNLYKSYIIPQQEIAKSAELIRLLKANRIQIGQLDKDIQVNAFDYFDQKTSNLKASKGDLLISAYQSAAPMIQALLDPTPVLEDSVTYDITAWNLFQLHGVRAYGVKEKLSAGPWNEISWQDNQVNENAVAYAFKAGTQSVALINQLLSQGYLVQFNDKEVGFGGLKYAPGFIWVTKKRGTWEGLKMATNHFQVPIYSIASFRSDVGADLGSTHFIHLNAKRFAVVVDPTFDVNQQGELAYYMTTKMQLAPSFIPLSQLFRSNLSTYSHLIFPNSKSVDLSKDKKSLLEDFVRKGGQVILFEKSGSIISDKELALTPKDLSDSADLKTNYEDAERHEISKTLSGNLVLANLEKTHPLGFRMNQNQVLIINQAEQLVQLHAKWKSIVETSKNTSFFGFMGSQVKPKIDNSLWLATNTLGSGSITWFGFNPLFRAIPNQTMTLFENALLYHVN